MIDYWCVFMAMTAYARTVYNVPFIWIWNESWIFWVTWWNKYHQRSGNRNLPQQSKIIIISRTNTNSKKPISRGTGFKHIWSYLLLYCQNQVPLPLLVMISKTHLLWKFCYFAVLLLVSSSKGKTETSILLYGKKSNVSLYFFKF